ncbi:hypothetical protein MN608_09739 [Microdochium nivale]|nr:hypothetical protein MN608_09739 [Microdochium nivale]
MEVCNLQSLVEAVVDMLNGLQRPPMRASLGDSKAPAIMLRAPKGNCRCRARRSADAQPSPVQSPAIGVAVDIAQPRIHYYDVCCCRQLSEAASAGNLSHGRARRRLAACMGNSTLRMP